MLLLISHSNMKRRLAILLLLSLLSGNVYSQILTTTTKTVLEAADKKVSELITSIISKKKKDTVAVTPAPIVNAAPVTVSAWTCDACGFKGNTGNFCTECGTKKPEPITPWDCPKCGKKGNTGNFCTECGTKKPEKIEPWTCPKCGKKENTGKFCTECGTPKPEEWICSVCGKANTGKFCDECGEKKPEVVIPDSGIDYRKYVQALSPEGPDKWILRLSLFDDETPATTLDFLTFKDAVDGTLELPTAKWMITSDSSAVWRIRQKNVEAALSIMADKYSNMAIGLNTIADSIRLNPAPEVLPKLAIDSADKAAALQQAGFSADEKTEGRIIGALIPYLAKKWELKESDIKNILQVAAADENLAVKFISEKYPDKIYTTTTTKRPEDDKALLYKAITDTLERINSEILSPYAVTLQEELKVAAEKIHSSWMESEECADVIELESTIDKMVMEWRKIDSRSKQYPSFWSDGRAAENTVIDSWNLKQAIKWRKIIEKHLELAKGYARKIAELENRIEQIHGSDDPTAEYLQAKIKCCTMISAIVKYATTPAAVLSMPMAKHVDETQKTN